MLRRLLFANFRLVHRADRALRRRFTPAGLLLLGGLLAAGIFGANTRQTLAFQVFALAVALLACAACAGLVRRRPFIVRRRLPPCGSVGQPLRYRVEITSTSDRPEAGLVLMDELAGTFPAFEEFLNSRDPEDRHRNWFDRAVGYPRLLGVVNRRRGGHIPPVPVPVIPPRGSVEVEVVLHPERRGRLDFSRLVLGRPDPLGLVRSLQFTAAPDRLLVLPRLYRVPRLAPGGGRQYQQGGMHLARSVGDSQEFLSLREYRPGDPLRAVHWRSFARLGKPVVKEFQDEFFVRRGLLLDTFIEDRDEAVFEEAVSVAASFAWAVADQDALVDLMFVGADAYRFTAGRGLAQRENLLEVLACVPACRDRPFTVLGDLVRRHLHELSALTCVFLDWDTQRQELAGTLRGAGIPLHVLVVTPDGAAAGRDAGPMADRPRQFLVLPPGRVQETLDGFAPALVQA